MRIRIATALSVLTFACGARVTVGILDAPSATDAGIVVDAEPGPSPPPFGDAARPDTGPPSPSCMELQCGDPCVPCEPDASTCSPPLVFHVCNIDSVCSPEQPRCIVIAEDAGDLPWSPCVGLTCGASCSPCDPARPECPGPGGHMCQADGRCTLDTAVCP